jgi:hypothetical protein
MLIAYDILEKQYHDKLQDLFRIRDTIQDCYVFELFYLHENLLETMYERLINLEDQIYKLRYELKCQLNILIENQSISQWKERT